MAAMSETPTTSFAPQRSNEGLGSVDLSQVLPPAVCSNAAHHQSTPVASMNVPPVSQTLQHITVVQVSQPSTVIRAPERRANKIMTVKPGFFRMSPGVNLTGGMEKRPSVIAMKSESPASESSTSRSGAVVLVNDFYYGTFESDGVSVSVENTRKPSAFKCRSCGKRLKNNISLMNHVKHHAEKDQQNRDLKSTTICPLCFDVFHTPFHLQHHLQSVHGTADSYNECQICELSFQSDSEFVLHMRDTHEPREMPYVCQVCEYRSSFYSDIYRHFCSRHEDTRYLLCEFCLKVFKSPVSFQQHYFQHYRSPVDRCNKCRLQFLQTSKKEKMKHLINHHVTFQKPNCLQSETKMRIDALDGKSCGRVSRLPSEACTKTRISVPNETGRKLGTSFLVRFHDHVSLSDKQTCLECSFIIQDFSKHYQSFSSVRCSLCSYSTCCTRAYTNHIIRSHCTDRLMKSDRRRTAHSDVTFICSGCEYFSTRGNLMAKHLLMFPAHSPCKTLTENSYVGLTVSMRFAELLPLTRAVITCQKRYRMVRARRQYVTVRWAVVIIQALVRGVITRRMYQKLRLDYKAVIIQKTARGWLKRKTYLRTRHAAVVIQRFYRHVRAERCQEEESPSLHAEMLLQEEEEIERLRAGLQEAHAHRKHVEEENFGLKQRVEELENEKTLLEERIQSPCVDGSDRNERRLHVEQQLERRVSSYDHLTRRELLGLLIQRDMELKEMKMYNSDMKDYIDMLLVHVMEQAPMMLEV